MLVPDASIYVGLRPGSGLLFSFLLLAGTGYYRIRIPEVFTLRQVAGHALPRKNFDPRKDYYLDLRKWILPIGIYLGKNDSLEFEFPVLMEIDRR